MFAAAAMAWAFPLRRLDTIDDVIRSSADRDRIVAPVRKGYGFWQTTLPLGSAAVPIALLATAGDFTARNIAMTANYAWTMFFLGNVSYWLIVPPLMVIRMRKCSDLALRWNDPARTPGIRTLSEGYAYPALFLALGALAVTLPGLLGNAPLLGTYQPYLYGILLALSLWVGALTQLVIFVIIRRYRLRLLDTLAGAESYRLSEGHVAEIFERVRITEAAPITLAAYNSIAGAPGLPYGTSLIVQYAAALVGSLVGFLLQ
jgi:hypothetical protein